MRDLQQIPAGYKQTDAGVIPKDWEAKPLVNLIRFTNGKAHEQSIDPFGKYIVINSKFVSTNGAVVKRSNKAMQPVKKNDIVMVMSDVPNGKAIAKCFMVNRDNLYTLNQRICSMTPLLDDGNYLLLQINRNPYYLSFDDGAKQTNLRREDVLSLQVKMPSSIDEQKKISSTLSNINSLISKLDQLIQKKKNIKQGAMQELLTGKRRLPGFSGEWEVQILSKITEMNSGGTPSTKISNYYGGDILWASIADMTDSVKFISSTEKKLTKSGISNSSATPFPKGTVLYAMYASIGECCIAAETMATSQAILGIRCSPLIINEYLYYYLTSIKEYIKTLGQQGTQSNLNKGMVQKFELKLPSADEQKAIVNILSNIDLEIEAVEKEKAKYKNLKQGMMQQLLTGKIRLIEPRDESNDSD